MEYVPGTDLKTLLQTRGRFSVDEAVPLLIQACAGIGYAHRAGLVHCDVKPQNMLVTPDQRLKVTDFGIARALASIQPDEKSNVVWGSPQYFSPEQAAGAAPSPASDVYALGVVMYEMLTGRLPFTGDTAAELAQMHRSTPTPPPRHFNPSIPPALEQIILKVLSKEPSARYRTADQLGRVLMSFNRTTTVSPAVEAVHTPPGLRIQPPAAATFSRPAPTPAPIQARPQPLPPAPVPSQPVATPSPDDPLNIDWGTWAMALLAAIAVLGLVPLWTWVFLLYSR
jgi:serine/threonine-protein kinase